MNERVQMLLDHFEITRLIYEYCRGCDRMDEARLAGVYADESWDDHGEFKGPAGEFVARTMRKVSLCETCTHLVGQSVTSIRDDEAGAETYFVAFVRTRDDAGEQLHQIGGRYVDTLVRERGEWKISHRVCVREWSLSQPIAADWLEAAPFARGFRSGEDPSFAVLGQRHGGGASLDPVSSPHSQPPKFSSVRISHE